MKMGISLRLKKPGGLSILQSSLRLALDFLSGKLDPRVTFSRAGPAGCFGSDGRWQTIGYNLVIKSDDLTDVSYGRYNTSTPSANTLVRNSTASSFLNIGIGSAIGTQMAFQLKAKKLTQGGRIGLRIQGNYPDRVDALFDLSTGQLIGSAGFNFTVGVATISAPDADGYYLCAISCTAANSAITSVLFAPGDSTASIAGFEGPSTVVADVLVKNVCVTTGSLSIPTFSPTGLTTLGPELVVNPNMSDGTTGWSAAYMSSVYAVNGMLRVMATGGNNPYGRQLVTVVPGKQYRVQVGPLKSSTAGGWNTYLGSTSSTYSVEYGISPGSANTNTVITATTNILNIAISAGGQNEGDYCDVTGFSVREVIPGVVGANSGPRFDYDPATPAVGGYGPELATTTSVTISAASSITATGAVIVAGRTYKVLVPIGTQLALTSGYAIAGTGLFQSVVANGSGSASLYSGGGVSAASFSVTEVIPATNGVEAMSGGGKDLALGTTGWNSFSGTPSSFTAAAGVATMVCSAVGQGMQSNVVYLTSARTYKVSMKVVSCTGAFAFGVIYGGVWESPVSNVPVPSGTTGTISFTYRSVSGSAGVQFMAWAQNAAGTLVFSNISVQEVVFTPRGLLIEEQRTNLLLWSRDMTNAVWINFNATVAKDQVGADGTTGGACKVLESAVSSIHGAMQSVNSVAVAAGATYSGSALIKATGRNRAGIWIHDGAGGNGGYAYIDLTTGAISAVTNTGGTGTVATSENVGNGFWRLKVTSTNGAASTSSPQLRVYCSDGIAAHDVAYLGDVTKGIIIDYAQLEVGATASTPIATTTAAVTRAADSAVMTPGLIAGWYSTTGDGTYVGEFDIASTLSGNTAIIGTSGKPTLAIGNTYVKGSYPGVVDVVTKSATVSGNGDIHKAAFSFKQGDYAVTLDGAVPATSTSAQPVSVPLQLSLGNEAVYLNGHIRSLKYFNTRLPDAKLQQLTL